MTYVKGVWVDDDGSGVVGTPVSAGRMNQIEQGIADAHLLASPLVVTALPGQPFEGQEVRYQTMAMVQWGVPPWRLCYRALNPDGSPNSSPYKWEVVGATELGGFNGSNGYWSGVAAANTGSGSFASMPGSTPGCAITLPLAGDYMIEYGLSGQCTTATGQDVFCAVFTQGNAQMTASNDCFARSPGSQFFKHTLRNRTRLNGRPMGEVLDVRGRVDGGGSYEFYGAFITATPIRVG